MVTSETCRRHAQRAAGGGAGMMGEVCTDLAHGLSSSEYRRPCIDRAPLMKELRTDAGSSGDGTSAAPLGVLMDGSLFGAELARGLELDSG